MFFLCLCLKKYSTCICSSWHELGGLVLARVTFVKARLVGEDHQQIGFHHGSPPAPPGIVIAKTDFSSPRCRFRLSRHDHRSEQAGVERAARVEVAVAVGEVIVR